MTAVSDGQMPMVATFSIVAADVKAGDVGVAVASKFLAAGAVVAWANAGAGAVATQAFANTSYGPEGIALMGKGLSAEEALYQLVAADDGRDVRQVGIVDAKGRAASHTGKDCHGWAGSLVGEGFACQGNIITGEETLTAMAASFRQSSGNLAERLFAALAAGEAAGGDRRGRQSAALYVAREKGGYLGRNDVLVDLRVDDSAEPVQELGRLLSLRELYFGSSPAGEKLPIEGRLLTELLTMAGRGDLAKTKGNRPLDEPVFQALDAFISAENFEERIDLKAATIDAPVMAFLRQKFRG